MISTFQLKKVYSNILQKLLLFGRLDTNSILRLMNTFVNTHNTNMPIFIGAGRLLRITAPPPK